MMAEPVWSVSEVNRAVRDLIEGSLHPFWIKGEVSNLLPHRSGHAYLSLKDEHCQIRAAYFGGTSAVRSLNLQNGMMIEAYGKLTVYDVRGEYQFSIKSIRLAGAGDLQRRFDELKRRLDAEGLFAPERKLPLPRLPRCIGIITSPTGAAIRDFLQITDRRFPDLHIRLYPVQVQGAGAAESVVRGIQFFNRTGDADVIVVTRGGGSMEDLWAFNEECVARAVADSRIPVISAIGHEIDFTICDFAADLRAPTPSAAAELVVGQRDEVASELAQYRKVMRHVMEYRLLQEQRRLDQLAASTLFREPAHLLEVRSRQLDEWQLRMGAGFQSAMTAAEHRLEALSLRLAGVDPAGQLKRGYAILVRDADGMPVTSAQGHPAGEAITAQLADGELSLTVRS